MEDFIQVKEENVIRIGIKNSNGEDTGLVIKFDLQDVELPLRINKMDALHKKNVSVLKQQAAALDKQEDKKGKFLLSYKEEKKLELLKEYYKKEMEALDLLIGDGMTQKILDKLERKPYYNMFDDIVNPLAPVFEKLEVEADKLLKSIEEKYGVSANDNAI